MELEESYRRDRERIGRDRGVKDTKIKSTKSNNLDLLALTETKPTISEPSLVWPRLSAYVLWLSCMIFWWESYQWEQGLSLACACFWDPFSAFLNMVDLPSINTRWGAFLMQLNRQCLVDNPGRPVVFWRKGGAVEGGIRWRVCSDCEGRCKWKLQ